MSNNIDDIGYKFQVTVGDDTIEVWCDAYPPGSWLVVKDGTVWDVQSPLDRDRVDRTFDGDTAPDAAVGYCVSRMLEEMRHGTVYG